MRLLILYRQNSEHEGIVDGFVEEYKRRDNSARIELINVDSREGIALATLYDVVEYPAILVLQGDGQVQKIWQGSSLPLLDEVASYINA